MRRAVMSRAARMQRAAIQRARAKKKDAGKNGKEKDAKGEDAKSSDSESSSDEDDDDWTDFRLDADVMDISSGDDADHGSSNWPGKFKGQNKRQLMLPEVERTKLQSIAAASSTEADKSKLSSKLTEAIEKARSVPPMVPHKEHVL